ncbi:hypothetical protein SynRS9915_00414 [Synechococcus sp. RS9915]|nr:hypothetical protein SynRS9915_00414 [Synechococcus sp. RS9915]
MGPALAPQRHGNLQALFTPSGWHSQIMRNSHGNHVAFEILELQSKTYNQI